MKDLNMNIGNYRFEFVAIINEYVRYDNNGNVFGYNHWHNYKNIKKLPLNKYGNATFCDFNIPKFSTHSGVYTLLINDETIPIYIGRTLNFDLRWGTTNYAHISPRNCFRGGQSTNCHINGLIYDLISNNNIVKLFFYETLDYKNIEKELIRTFQPSYNIIKN